MPSNSSVWKVARVVVSVRALLFHLRISYVQDSKLLSSCMCYLCGIILSAAIYTSVLRRIWELGGVRLVDGEHLQKPSFVGEVAGPE